MQTALNLSLILFLPLVSALLIVLFMRRRGNLATFTSVIASFGIMALSLYFLINWDGQTIQLTIPWFSLSNLTISMGFLINHLAVTMLLVVSFVAFWIHFFSVGYMNEDKDKGRYFAGLSIFMFSMLGIVLADNLIMLFIFWELVGFSSYALIAHYSATSCASHASKKAFIVNRVGEFGFLIGIIWTYWEFGTVDLVVLAAKVNAQPELISDGIGFLLVCGFLGKSAQFPLQVWLPDAMAGPTPVSALIHASTMVAAGIYFIARVFFLFPAEVLHVILWLGALMTVYAGICALGQTNMKKILAYSTLSQLGYMGVALGLELPGLAMFHLATHACFKALLFLGSGSVIHAIHHEEDIFRMGGLFKRMPITTFTFAFGLLALCGATYTAGYFSKDPIIAAALLQNKVVFYLIMFAAFLTALYIGRLFWIAFLGTPRTQHAEKAHESNFFMTLPLIVLAALSVISGYVFLWPKEWCVTFIKEFKNVHDAIESSGNTMMILIVTTLAWVVGLLLSYILYKPGSKEDSIQAKMPALYNFFKSKLWFDEIYDFYVAKIQNFIANILNFFDIVFIGGLLVRGLAGVCGLFSIVIKSSHIGTISSYVYWFLAGVLIFGAFAFGIL